MITADILVSSLANFYCQYADRHMNMKFMRHISERQWAIRQFVMIVKNKLMSVFNESVCEDKTWIIISPGIIFKRLCLCCAHNCEDYLCQYIFSCSFMGASHTPLAAGCSYAELQERGKPTALSIRQLGRRGYHFPYRQTNAIWSMLMVFGIRKCFNCLHTNKITKLINCY